MTVPGAYVARSWASLIHFSILAPCRELPNAFRTSWGGARANCAYDLIPTSLRHFSVAGPIPRMAVKSSAELSSDSGGHSFETGAGASISTTRDMGSASALSGSGGLS